MKEDVSMESERSHQTVKTKPTRKEKRERRKEAQRRRQREAERKEREFRASLSEGENTILLIGRTLIVLGFVAVGIFWVLGDWFSVYLHWAVPAAGGTLLAIGLIIEGLIRLGARSSRHTVPDKKYQPVPVESYQSQPTYSKKEIKETETTKSIT
jgi:hypothetical protein